MFDYKIWISNNIVKPFKAFPYLGRQRFWFLYWCYKLTGWHVRSKEWDFVLEYLPKLGDWQKVHVLDVGCSRNLFCHEIVYRGYKLAGIDLEVPQFKYPGTFSIGDIRKGGVRFRDFVTCISVLEHIEEGQDKALNNMVECLKVGGRLLLTIPTHEFAQGHPWHGFTYKEVMSLLPDNAMIIDYTERAGQLCLAIERTN